MVYNKNHSSEHRPQADDLFRLDRHRSRREGNQRHTGRPYLYDEERRGGRLRGGIDSLLHEEGRACPSDREGDAGVCRFLVVCHGGGLIRMYKEAAA